MLNIRTLQILVEVARQGGFSRAALAGHDGDDLRQGSYLLFVNLTRYSGAFLILAKARG